jgi:hypothetical protein
MADEGLQAWHQQHIEKAFKARIKVTEMGAGWLHLFFSKPILF